jgi:hypothetical protein
MITRHPSHLSLEGEPTTAVAHSTGLGTLTRRSRSITETAQDFLPLVLQASNL